MDLCLAAPKAAGFISSVTNAIDCQARLVGHAGWAALATPGSLLSSVLTGFLTILVAAIGYNLLLGGSVTLRSTVIVLVKISAVCALATSWPAYKTLVYDLVTDGPAELVASIGPGGGVVGSDGSLGARLDVADQTLARLAVLGAGNADEEPGEQISAEPFAGFNSFAFGGSRILFDLTAIGGPAAVRMISGLMLALGPFFIAFVMFEGTKTLFEGWVRVLIGAALGAVGVSVSLGFELALLQPWLESALAARTAGNALPNLPAELFVLTSLFAAITFVALLASVRLASAFRLPGGTPTPTNPGHSAHIAPTPMLAAAAAETDGREMTQSRAAAVATALLSAARRESRDSWLDRQGALASHRPWLNKRDDDALVPTARTGRTLTRSQTLRVSARAAKRDEAR
jgi:type IV secretion system protein VirB6